MRLLGSSAGALLLAVGHAQLLPGCGIFGCSPGLWFATGLQLPFGGVRTAWSTLPQAVDHACAHIASAGCISQSGNLMCTYPLECNASDWSVGVVGLNSTGDILYTFDGLGSGRCAGDASAGAHAGTGTGRGAQPSTSRIAAKPFATTGVETLGVMDIFGDVVVWDNAGLSFLQDGDPSWQREIGPPSYCGDTLASISVSNTSRLMFYISTAAEVFGYYANGVPVADVILHANSTSAAAIDVPRDVDDSLSVGDHDLQSRGLLRGSASAAGASASAHVNDWPANGIAVPISPQTSNGIRFMYVCRLYLVNESSSSGAYDAAAEAVVDGRSSGGPKYADAETYSQRTITRDSSGIYTDPFRPPMTPTSELLIAAVDLYDGGVPRMGRPWQLPLPLTADIKACVPASNGNMEGLEPLFVAGPLVLPDSSTMVFALSCNRSAMGNTNAAVVDSVAALNMVHLYGLVIDAAPSQAPVPSVLWQTNFTLDPAVSFNEAVAKSMFLHLPSSSSAPAASSNSCGADPAVPATNSSVVWVAPLQSSVMTAIDAVSGTVLGVVDVAASFAAANATSCPLARDFTAHNTGAASAAEDDAGILGFAISGRPIASGLPSSFPGSNVSSLVVFTGSVVGGNASVLPGIPQYWIAGIQLLASTSSDDEAVQGNVLWCLPTPAVTGHADSTAWSADAQTTADGDGIANQSDGAVVASDGQFPVEGQFVPITVASSETGVSDGSSIGRLVDVHGIRRVSGQFGGLAAADGFQPDVDTSAASCMGAATAVPSPALIAFVTKGGVVAIGAAAGQLQ